MHKKIKWDQNNLNIYRDEEKTGRRKKFALTLVLIALLALSFFFGYRLYLKRHTTGRYDQFVEAIAATDYDRARELYRQVQKVAVEEVDPEAASPYKEIQVEMEKRVSDDVRRILEGVLAGQSLTSEEKEYISGLEDISAVEIMPLLYERSEAWLDGQIDALQWEALITAFQGLKNLEPMLSDLYQQKAGLELATVRFKVAKEIEAKGDWERTWQYWQDIVEDQNLAAFARNYAEFHLKAYQEKEYSNLLQLAREMGDRGRYYSARKLIDRMYGVFPERSELKAELEKMQEQLPAKLSKWTEAVPVLAVRPLIARADVAFRADGKHQHAANNLLLPEEYRRLLDALYSEGYVLIRPSIFLRYPESPVEIIVPEEKKPLLLLFENAAYTSLNQANGTVQKLVYHDDQFLGFYDKLSQQVLAPDNNLFGLTEAFIAEHPDFVFDGGRPVISLYFGEDCLGYILNERQLTRQNEARQNLSLQPYTMDDEDYQKERKEARELLEALIYRGYLAASAGVGTELYNQLTVEELRLELAAFLETWQELELNTSLQTLVFPEGGHVYDYPEALDLLLGQGFRLMFGMGPKPYNFYFPSFAHLDRQTVSPLSLQNPSAWGLDLVLDEESLATILDKEIR